MDKGFQLRSLCCYYIEVLNAFQTQVKRVIESGLDSFFQLDFNQDEEHFNATIREPIRKEYLNVKNWMPAQLSRRYTRYMLIRFHLICGFIPNFFVLI